MTDLNANPHANASFCVVKGCGQKTLSDHGACRAHAYLFDRERALADEASYTEDEVRQIVATNTNQAKIILELESSLAECRYACDEWRNRLRDEVSKLTGEIIKAQIAMQDARCICGTTDIVDAASTICKHGFTASDCPHNWHGRCGK